MWWLFNKKKPKKVKTPLSSKLYNLARKEIGVMEVPGSGFNPKIIQYFEEAGHGWVNDDETPWCAAFVGAMCKRAGVLGTGQLNARSYLDWGRPVRLDEARQGDVVIFWRESPGSWKGHVGFYHNHDKNYIHVLGANQSDAVNIQYYPKSRLLGVRRK